MLKLKSEKRSEKQATDIALMGLFIEILINYNRENSNYFIEEKPGQ